MRRRYRVKYELQRGAFKSGRHFAVVAAPVTDAAPIQQDSELHRCRICNELLNFRKSVKPKSLVFHMPNKYPENLRRNYFRHLDGLTTTRARLGRVAAPSTAGELTLYFLSHRRDTFFIGAQALRREVGVRASRRRQVRQWRRMGFCQINGSLPPPRRARRPPCRRAPDRRRNETTVRRHRSFLREIYGPPRSYLTLFQITIDPVTYSPFSRLTYLDTALSTYRVSLECECEIEVHRKLSRGYELPPKSDAGKKNLTGDRKRQGRRSPKGLRARSAGSAVMSRAGQSINLNVRRRRAPTCNFFRSRAARLPDASRRRVVASPLPLNFDPELSDCVPPADLKDNICIQRGLETRFIHPCRTLNLYNWKKGDGKRAAKVKPLMVKFSSWRVAGRGGAGDGGDTRRPDREAV
ncbi:hypothetical protein EVAR_79092_1 [Eumeta japonica]|uniref:Uncharacterized protein n=1 Tax=Eumeta variegata TaxID=151549 RepID=A0A4C1WZI0_EUMVA|nr:hypothetical protein EVAR_79092_1 [Eumeta japonica]